MVYTQDSYSFLDTLQATAADISLANHILAITGCPRMDYRQIAPIQDPSTMAVASVAEVLQVTTTTPTVSSPAVGTVFAIQIVQDVRGSLIIDQLIYTVQSTSDTATTVCNAWRASLSTGKFKDTLTGSGTTTFILTAVTGTPVFQVNAMGNSLIVPVTGTPGVYAVGTTAALTAKGIPAASTNPLVIGWTSGHAYTTISFTFTSDDTNRGGDLQKGWSRHVLYVWNAATNYAAFLARLQEVIGAVDSGGDADPEAIAIGS